MAFQFALEALLRFRSGVERQRKLRLLEAVRQEMVLRREIANLDRQMAEIAENEYRELTAGTRASRLQFDMVYRSALGEKRLVWEKLLLQQNKLRVQLQEEFQRARREREALDVLREQYLERYQQLEKWRAQRQLDDLYLLRRHYLRRS